MIPLELLPLAILVVMTQWTLFQGLHVFPIIALAIRIWQTQNESHRSILDRVMPNPGTTKSMVSNMILALINGLGWASVLLLADNLLGTLWQDVFGLNPPEVMTNWSLPVQVLALMVLLDFVNYWSHRLLHRRWMWGFHQLHHSDEHMNFTTASRIHLGEGIQMQFISVMLIGWLVLPAEAVVIAGFIRGWYSMYIHSRLPWDHGPLKRVLASPNYHEWHHCNDPAVYGKNLCDMFPIWDIMFGTYYNPGRCDKPLGVPDAPDDIVSGQLYPVLYWKRLWNEHRSRKAVSAVQPLEAEPAT